MTMSVKALFGIILLVYIRWINAEEEEGFYTLQRGGCGTKPLVVTRLTANETMGHMIPARHARERKHMLRLTVGLWGWSSLTNYAEDYFLNLTHKYDVVFLTGVQFWSSSSSGDIDEIVSRGGFIHWFNYSSVDTMAQSLLGIHTLVDLSIGTIGGIDLDEFETLGIKDLIHPLYSMMNATKKAGVQRIIFGVERGDPQQFGTLPKKSLDFIDSTSMEYTIMCTGFPMNYMEYVVADIWAVGIRRKTHSAIIPGTGNELFSTTMSTDIPKAIESLLDAPDGTWDKFTYLNGEVTNWNNILSLLEKETGTKFTVNYTLEERGFAAREYKRWVKGEYLLPARSAIVDTFQYTTVADQLSSLFKM